jgi:cytochrome c
MTNQHTTTSGRDTTCLHAAALFVITATAACAGAQNAVVDDNSPRVPGASLRLWHVEEPMSRLPTLVDGQTPNASGVVDYIDFGEQDFFGYEDYFYIEIDGEIVADEPGTYGFRVDSDDGSEFIINGEQLFIADRLQGITTTTGEIELDAGRHPFLIRFFENTGGAGLSFYWRPPGKDDWSLVQGGDMVAQADEVRVTSPGTKKIVVAGRVGRPGDRQPLRDVHPSFELEAARPSSFDARIGGMAWDGDDLLVCAWDPDGAVYRISGYDQVPYDPEHLEVTKIADGLAEPLGLEVVDGRIYVLQKQELTELIDHDGDGVTDEYRAIAAGWEVSPNFHEFAFGLLEQDGMFYFTLAIAIDPGGASTQPQVEGRGTVVRVDPATGSYEFIADGLRTPNGIGAGPNGEILVTDNQGDWLPVSKLIDVEEGDFFGSYDTMGGYRPGYTEKPPIVWLPQGEIGNSPGEPGHFPDWHPYAGQLLHADITHGGLKRTFVEDIDGQLQGAVFRFAQGLEAGTNRWRWGPDRRIYLGGIGSTGNWGQAGKQRFGLERMTYTGAPVLEMAKVEAAANGLVITLSAPLAEHLGRARSDYDIQQWRYEPTSAYGGPKLDQTELDVTSVRISSDRTRIELIVDGIEPGHVVYVRLPGEFYSEDAGLIWSTEAWYTMNRVPTGPVLSPNSQRSAEPNTLTASEVRDGWELLFDGESLDRWRSMASDEPPLWIAIDDRLVVRPGSGDLISKDMYTDFEFSVEWKVSEGGNSGMFYGGRIMPGMNYIWETAPEMQILDNTTHPDGRSALTSAGANYALHAPPRDVTRPVGTWNHARIVKRGANVEHWLNGEKVVEYAWGSDDWKRLVAGSKFASMPHYGKYSDAGHLGLQDHGDRVEFRNIKIRHLD